MPERILSFGKLEDIIFIKDYQIEILTKEIDDLRDEFFPDPENCSRSNLRGCCNCNFANDCEEAKKLHRTEIKLLEDEKERINQELILLWHELHFHEQVLYDQQNLKRRKYE